ncbi:trehalose-phosphatase [Helicocarpus griseus UAMH5409]|uniref:Trehalose-phosphatase n=1 Tax=Helicocarpus griseus UAMH5409 TaxID=1447875 RepID=A0A2B7WW78_9EURO|nr:trehalose-phosphatase [Helicocarpus griseus UAMH5409]
MTVFVVSLFLPYTVNFQLPTNGLLSRRTSSPKRRHAREGSSEIHRRQFGSLFHQHRKSSSSSSRPAFLKEQAQRTAALASDRPVVEGDQPGYPFPAHPHSQSLAPSDPHSPTWGTEGKLNQPKPQPLPSPALSVLQHGVGVGVTKSSIDTARQLGAEQPIADNQVFSEADWTIVASHQGNGGLRNAVRSALNEGFLGDKLWVGTVGMPTNALDEHVKDTIAEKLEVDFDSLTVYVDDSDFDGHYLHFCKTILWPVFHYQIPDNPKSKAYEDHSWIYYVNVNQAFADRIVHNWKRDDVIWIHDYHLLLVPGMVRKQIPDAQIGFFLHIAFPSSEVFRCLAVREELLQGMLGANLIGFQAQEYCHHFLQTCSRILTVEATKEGVQLEDRFVNVGTFPIGIDIKALDQRRGTEEVSKWKHILKDTYDGKRLVVARDKLDNIRGVRQKLLSYELFLRKNPQWQGKVVLIQVALSTADQPELDATVSDIVTRINSAFSSLAYQPLIFLKQDINFDQYIALISMADTLMVTSLREGMNLTSHEFIHCQDGKYPGDKKHGSLILSEFTGSASLFDGHTWLVNPWNYKQCAEALNDVLEFSPEQKEREWTKLNDIIMKHTTSNWLKTFIEALSKAWNEQSLRDTVSIPRLSVSDLSARYKESSRRLFILDYEGTLASWGSPTSIVLTTPKRALDTLNDLIEDPKNIVYVMSSRMPEELERLFRHVPGLGLIAENGCYIREANTEEWLKLVKDDRTKEWKDGVADMVRYFHERTEGSWIEHMHSSLVFHFANAEDPLAAERHAADCANHINDTCASHDVHAVVDMEVGDLIVEPIVPNKATAGRVVLDSIQRSAQNSNTQKPDFLFVVGDGREDEVIFRWANELGDQKVIKNVLTTTLGSKNTEAMATLTQGVTGKYDHDWSKRTITNLTGYRGAFLSWEAGCHFAAGTAINNPYVAKGCH